VAATQAKISHEKAVRAEALFLSLYLTPNSSQTETNKSNGQIKRTSLSLFAKNQEISLSLPLSCRGEARLKNVKTHSRKGSIGSAAASAKTNSRKASATATDLSPQAPASSPLGRLDPIVKAKQDDGFKNGDKVRVAKAGGSTYAKEGVVTNPDWMGRVKIVLDGGETKSYLPTELLLLESVSAADNSTADTSAVSAFIEHAKLQMRVEWKGEGDKKNSPVQGPRSMVTHRSTTAGRLINQATMESAALGNGKTVAVHPLEVR
jgi:hypothetical protein